jgi:glutamine synthetase
MPKLAEKHKEHLTLYGTGNEKRLTGLHETSSMDSFTYNVRSRGASVRIPVTCE